MKKPSREALQAYYKEAGSWAADRNADLVRSRQIAWVVALLAVIVAFAEAVALMLLMPLKTAVPYTLLVDRTTGYVEALQPLNPDRVTPDEALTQSMLVQYVIAREGFDVATVQNEYRRVGLWSADQARSEYLATMQPSNEASPLSRYPRSTVIEARVKSVSPLSDETALVRFETQRRDQGGAAQDPSAWVAVVRYRFSGEPMAVEDRFLNPLGFQVVGYRRDAEAIVPPEGSTSSSIPSSPQPDPAVVEPSALP